MRIIYIKLKNFIGVHAAMGLRELELSFDQINKPIIQIYGKNRCGKTVLIQQLHPFSSINLNGDERSDLSLILPKEEGIKNIVYEVDGEVYNITHTYSPTRTGHTISSSILHNGEELNPSGGVTAFNSIIERILGINKYVFQFIINGTQLTSFANMSTTQRKNLLNKALGIDIYDKIHKLATDDYRYTNKLITSLNNTKEYILSTYGSYETLCAMLNQKQNEADMLAKQILDTKSNMDKLSGEISVINSQSPQQELLTINHRLTAYKNVIDEMGTYDPNMYDKLIQEQIDLNSSLSSLKNQRTMIRKDIDLLYEKKNDIENTMMASKRAADDYNNMLNMRDELKQKISDICIEMHVSGSSSYYRSMIQPAQAINDTCTEIVSCLNENHLKMFTEMISNGIDVNAFLIQEGSILLDSEKEISAVSRVRRMIEGVEGEWTDKKCDFPNCLYRNTHKMLETYFKSYQGATSSQFTQYDLEQIEHANKNVQTIKRLLGIEVPVELKEVFNLNTIMMNIQKRQIGIDVSYIKYLMEEAAKGEQRTQFISQLSDVERTITNMKGLMLPTDNMDDTIRGIEEKISDLRNKDTDIDGQIRSCEGLLDTNDRQRLLLSQVKHLNIDDLNRRHGQLTLLIQKLHDSEQTYNQLYTTYNEMIMRSNVLNNELKNLSDAYNQYVNTVAEIDKHDTINGRYKIIAEATSSTKGKPVIAIRDTVENALSMTNRLLDIMYDGEIEMLDPVIDENNFILPFRCGSHMSSDIRYGSQSESTLLSLALEMALSSLLTKYNVFLIDECDGYLDSELSESYITLLKSVLSVIGSSQCFVISHHVGIDNEHLDIHQLNLENEVIKQCQQNNGKI